MTSRGMESALPIVPDNSDDLQNSLKDFTDKSAFIKVKWMCRLTSSEAANFTELHKESVLPL
jgi:hypothetical protein